MNQVLLMFAGFLAVLVTGIVILFKAENMLGMLMERAEIYGEDDNIKNYRR